MRLKCNGRVGESQQNAKQATLLSNILYVHPDDFLLNLLIFFIRMILPDEFELNLLRNFIRMDVDRLALPDSRSDVFEPEDFSAPGAIGGYPVWTKFTGWKFLQTGNYEIKRGRPQADNERF